jgi:leader peptidase (prepilin peptidase) / N-methyltransferase
MQWLDDVRHGSRGGAAGVVEACSLWHSESMLPPVLVGAFTFAFGLIIGSFLNVCILRLPEGKSIVQPASACPNCGAKIRPYDNIPVLSWLILRGKCRRCLTPISPMYPVVEFLTGLLFLCCYLAFGLTVEALKWSTFVAVLVVLVFTDFRERILPDVINFVGFGLGLLLSLFTPSQDGTALWLSSRWFDFAPPAPILSLIDALLGAALGAGVMWLIAEGYFRLRGKEGMGFGDVKMMLMAGAFLGWKRTLLTMLVGSMIGSFLGIAFMLARRKNSDYELPFGSFLGMAALLVVFFGNPVVQWYQGFFHIQ